MEQLQLVSRQSGKSFSDPRKIIAIRSFYNRPFVSRPEMKKIAHFLRVPLSFVMQLCEQEKGAYVIWPHLDPHRYRTKYSRSGEVWSDWEIMMAVSLTRRGCPRKYVANALHRTNYAVSRKVCDFNNSMKF